jgi:hypothetical protein
LTYTSSLIHSKPLVSARKYACANDRTCTESRLYFYNIILIDARWKHSSHSQNRKQKNTIYFRSIWIFRERNRLLKFEATFAMKHKAWILIYSWCIYMCNCNYGRHLYGCCHTIIISLHSWNHYFYISLKFILQNIIYMQVMVFQANLNLRFMNYLYIYYLLVNNGFPLHKVKFILRNRSYMCNQTVVSI